MEKYYIASVSWGKDSTAMLLRLLAYCMPLDEVVFFDTGKEFDAIYHARDKFIFLLEERGIKYTELKPPYSFDYLMFDKPIKTRNGEKKTGYGWCGGLCRWFTTCKIRTINDYYKHLNKDVIEYIGIAKDEPLRYARLKPNQRAPLYDWGITEEEALRICYNMGYDFEGLYTILKRVSCWCCRNKNLKEIENYKKFLPDYYQKLLEIEERLNVPMKGDKFLKERFPKA